MSNTSDSRHASVTFRSLGAGGLVLLCADACLDLRPARLPCSKCQDACPVSALSFTADGAMLADQCIGCGRCAVACPASALAVSGFDLGSAKRQAQRTECRRVPEQLSERAAIVPCVGGISAELLLELTAQGQEPCQFVDRGWCGTCAAGNGRAGTIFDAFEEVARMLSALGVPADRQPKVVREHIPVKFARPVAAAADDSRVSRRGFLGAFMRKAVETAERSTAPQVQLSADRGGCKPSPVIKARQERVAANLRQLAAMQGRVVSAAMFPHLEIAGHCDHTGLCAAICPTGALRRYDEGSSNAAGLEFEADTCIGCGLCASQCPHQAIRLLPAGNAGDSALPGATKLTRYGKRVCPRCTTEFLSVGPAGSQCPRCEVDLNLARSMFGRLQPGELVKDQEKRNSLSSNFTAL